MHPTCKYIHESSLKDHRGRNRSRNPDCSSSFQSPPSERIPNFIPCCECNIRTQLTQYIIICNLFRVGTTSLWLGGCFFWVFAPFAVRSIPSRSIESNNVLLQTKINSFSSWNSPSLSHQIFALLRILFQSFAPRFTFLL